MKKILAAFLFLTAMGCAQAIRFETVAQTTNAQCTPGSQCPLLAVPGAQVQVYSVYPSVPATTYTDVTASTACPAYAQVTLPGSFSCTNASDSSGNVGFWVGQGTFYYTLTFPASAGGGVKGPFALTAGAAGILAPGTDTQVIYNKAGQFGADVNNKWNYTTGTLTLTNLSGNALQLDGNGASNQSSWVAFLSNGTPIWNVGRVTSRNNFAIQDDTISTDIMLVGPGAGQSINFFPTSGNVNFTGTADTPGISLLGGAFVFSTGGFLSQANSWQGVNSLTDGALLRGYAVAANSANTGGGYIDFAPITYNPHNGGSCVDANGNPVQQPLPLNGLGNFGSLDTIMWVTQSPQMPPGGACGAILPIQEDWGLTINSYFFARGGLATDNGRYNAINTIYLAGGVPAGGVEAGALIAGTLYPAGTVTSTGTLSVAAYLGGYIQVGISATDPATGTIATATNPLLIGDTVEAGTMYYNSANDCLKVANNALTFNCVGSGGGGGSPGGVLHSIQANSPLGSFGGDNLFTYTPSTSVSLGNASFITVGTSAGFDASTCTSAVCIQAPLGGILTGTLLTWKETATPGASNTAQDTVYADSTAHQLYWASNGGSTYAPIAILSGTLVNGHCPQITISAGQALLTDSAAPCGGGTGSGVVVASPQFQLPYYSSTGTTATVTGTSGLTFNPSVGTMTISGGSATGITMTNVSMTAAGVFQLLATTSNVDLTTATAYNAFQAPAGGIGNILSGTFVNYMQPGSYSGATGTGPTMTTGDTPHAGALSYSTASTCLAQYNGATWACLTGGGGSGTVTSALANQVAAYPANGTTVQGYSAFTFNNATTTLTVTGAGIVTTGAFNSSATGTAFTANSGTFSVTGAAGSTTVPQMSIAGYIASTGSTGGFNVTSNTAFNSIQTVGGISVCTGSGCASGIAISVGGVEVISSALSGALSSLSVSGVISTSGAIFTTVGLNVTSCTLTNCIQSVGGIQSTGTAAQNGGFSVTSDTAVNSIQTIGGVNSCNAGTCVSGIAYEVAGTKLIDSSLNAFVHNITITGTCTGCTSAAVSSITGTANQILANGTSGSAQTGAVTLTFPTIIATAEYNSTASGSSIAYQTATTTFQVDGYGDISSSGSVNATGNSTLGLAPFRVNGTAIVDSSRNISNIVNFTSTGSLTLGGVISSSAGAVFGATVAAPSFQVGGSPGVTCSGAPSGAFASANGIVTHC